MSGYNLYSSALLELKPHVTIVESTAVQSGEDGTIALKGREEKFIKIVGPWADPSRVTKISYNLL